MKKVYAMMFVFVLLLCACAPEITADLYATPIPTTQPEVVQQVAAAQPTAQPQQPEAGYNLSGDPILTAVPDNPENKKFRRAVPYCTPEHTPIGYSGEYYMISPEDFCLEYSGHVLHMQYMGVDPSLSLTAVSRDYIGFKLEYGDKEYIGIVFQSKEQNFKLCATYLLNRYHPKIEGVWKLSADNDIYYVYVTMLRSEFLPEGYTFPPQ